MEDRYNLCSGTDAQIGEISKLIYFTNIEPLIIQKSEPTAVEMGKGVCLGKSGFEVRQKALGRYFI